MYTLGWRGEAPQAVYCPGLGQISVKCCRKGLGLKAIVLSRDRDLCFISKTASRYCALGIVLGIKGQVRQSLTLSSAQFLCKQRRANTVFAEKPKEECATYTGNAQARYLFVRRRIDRSGSPPADLPFFSVSKLVYSSLPEIVKRKGIENTLKPTGVGGFRSISLDTIVGIPE